jgi:cell division transport system permease protein
MMRALRYALDEATASLWRGWQSSLLSTGTIAVALLVLGGFLLATSNLDRLADEWSRTAGMSVYLSDETTESDRQAVERLLAPGAVVEGFAYVSKAEALTRFKQTFADLTPTVESLERNPLPASYDVRLRAAGGSPGGLDALATLLRATSGVTDVRYDRQWLDRLLGAVSVVRLSLQARRDELDIMHLVGAPPAFVQGPFVMEGALQGGIGAAVALAILGLVFVVVRRPYLGPLTELLNLSAVRFLSPGLCVLLLGGGVVVGCLGGLLAGRRA